MQPNQYAVAHYRALWWETQDPPGLQEQSEVAINAVHCASQLVSKTPIYFATDSLEAQTSIRQYAANNHQSQQRPIVVIPHSKLVHLDRMNLTSNTVQDIYPVFVDLWLMAHANCIAVGDGGFGKYGLMLSRNYTCSYRHIYRHKIKKCEWKE